MQLFAFFRRIVNAAIKAGTYRIIWETIDKYNIEHFGCTQEELDDARLELQIMF